MSLRTFQRLLSKAGYSFAGLFYSAFYRNRAFVRAVLSAGLLAGFLFAQSDPEIGREVAIPHHLQDGDEFDLSIKELITYGKKLFEAHFTSQEGAGRPLTKGTGAPLSDPSSPLLFPRNNNRVSGPESNSCAGCHNQPISGGAGDLSTNVFVLAQRFDFATFNANDVVPTRGTLDERGLAATLQSIANSRSTVDMFGAGFYEMLARQITADLQSIRNTIRPGGGARLESKGISFGILARNMDGSWNTSAVEGLPPQSLLSSDAGHPPSLLMLPFPSRRFDRFSARICERCFQSAPRHAIDRALRNRHRSGWGWNCQ